MSERIHVALAVLFVVVVMAVAWSYMFFRAQSCDGSLVQKFPYGWTCVKESGG